MDIIDWNQTIMICHCEDDVLAYMLVIINYKYFFTKEKITKMIVLSHKKITKNTRFIVLSY